MKRIFCLIGLLGLCACDRPQYDIQLACEDGAKGKVLVDAKIYKTHADLVVKRLDKKLREKAMGQDDMWLADHVWLYNQIPQIGDTIAISLPVNEYGSYELAGKIKLELNRNSLTGGQQFLIWHMSDNNLTMRDGEKLPNGMHMVGTTCEHIVDPVNNTPQNITNEIKNCMNYIGSQLLYDSEPTPEAERRLRLYDENTGREMYLGESAWGEVFGNIAPNHFYLGNEHHYPEDALQACDVAARLRAYIAAHIDAEHIPPKPDAISVSSGMEMSINCGDEEIFIRGE